MSPAARCRRGTRSPARQERVCAGSLAASPRCGWRPTTSLAEHPALGLEEVGYPALRQVEKRLQLSPGEGRVLTGTLHLHKLRRLYHHDVGVHTGILVFGVG